MDNDTGVLRAAFASGIPRSERRRYARFTLCVPVVLYWRDGFALKTQTENLSAGGFFCRSAQHVPNEDPDGALVIFDPPHIRLTLACRVRLLQINRTGTDTTIRCEIEDYCVLNYPNCPLSGLAGFLLNSLDRTQPEDPE